MAIARSFDPSLHKRLIEIMDEVADINGKIESNVRLLDRQPALAADIKQLMARCTSLVSEAVELRTSPNLYPVNGTPRSSGHSGFTT